MNSLQTARSGAPSWSDKIVTHVQLLDPVTWLGPWQCLCCSVLASGIRWERIGAPELLKFFLVCGLVGPLLTGFSQSINDYFDRHLDAINDPERPIPSGRISLRAARINFCVTAALAVGNISLLFVLTGSRTTLALGLAGLALAFAYSAPGLRFKENGWLGTTSVGVGYCLIPWALGAELFNAPEDSKLVQGVLGVINGLVAMGLIAMNDFKAIEGDRRNGLKTLPVLYGVRGALIIAFVEMNLAQLLFVGLCFFLGRYIIGTIGAVMFIPQIRRQLALYRDPEDARTLQAIAKSSAGRSLVSQSQSGAHPGFIRFLVASNLLTVAGLTLLALAHGYFR
jgi:bacteriochlorophyll/chlorophyll synthetase